MPLRNLSFLLLILLALLQLSCRSKNNLVVPSPTPDRLSVENSIYRKTVSENFPDRHSFLVFDRTERITHNQESLLKLKYVDAETIADFVTKNESRFPLDENLQIDGEIVLTNWYDLRNQFRSNDPQSNLGIDFAALRSVYPNIEGILVFSKIGFNSEANQALVEVTLHDIFGACYTSKVTLLLRNSNFWEPSDARVMEICG